MDGIPLVADMSSMICSEPVDVSKYGVIYFGVQKNIAPAGMAVAIVRDDLLGKAAKGLTPDKNMQKRNAAKAKVLYDYLDGQDFYKNPVEKKYRSMMNVTFTSPDADTDKAFCAAATEAGFVNLKGHRLVGGMRASIYNAMPAEGIDKLVDFMEKFRREH